MSMFEIEEDAIPTTAKIVVIGVGGGGGNAVNAMIREAIDGVHFVVGNTDKMALDQSLAPVKIQLGKELTQGLGAGSDPAIGRESALEDEEDIRRAIGGANMVFVTAGMGGGTGTGAAPVVAKIARDMNALTVGVVTRPFNFEGRVRRENADMGIEELKANVDTLITIPNQKLFEVAGKEASFANANRLADNVLLDAVQGISDLITTPGMINVDFADVRTIMSNRGMALMGIGRASGKNRAQEAARRAINSPLLDNVSIHGATALLINITCDVTFSMVEMDEVSSTITESVDERANIIYGQVFDPSMGDELQVTVIATGFPHYADQHSPSSISPKPRRTSFQDPTASAEVPRRPPQRPHMTFSGGSHTDNRDLLTDEQPRRTSKFLRSTAAVNVSSPEAKRPIDDRDSLDVPTFLRKSNSPAKTVSPEDDD